MSQNSKKVIIVGKTGHGKSSLGNSLLANKEKRFTAGDGLSAITIKCQMEKYGQFEIVDTPGLFDTNQKRNVAQQAQTILDALKLCPAPHAFLIVFKYDRFTAEEVSVLDVLGITFGRQCFDHAIVVFTHVNNDEKLKKACKESYQVNELLELCGQRVVGIDNENPNREQVNALVQYIDQVSKDGESCFKNNHLSCHDEVLRRCAEDVNKYDGMLVHEQLEQIANEIKAMVNEEVTREKKEKEERAKKEREERAKREREERAKRERRERAKREREERRRQQKEKEDREKKKKIDTLLLFLFGAGLVATCSKLF